MKLPAITLRFIETILDTYWPIMGAQNTEEMNAQLLGEFCLLINTTTTTALKLRELKSFYMNARICWIS